MTGGTGLGLAIARWAVELHGGSIGVADSATGCTMRVVLPAARATSTARLIRRARPGVDDDA